MGKSYRRGPPGPLRRRVDIGDRGCTPAPASGERVTLPARAVRGRLEYDHGPTRTRFARHGRTSYVTKEPAPRRRRCGVQLSDYDGRGGGVPTKPLRALERPVRRPRFLSDFYGGKDSQPQWRRFFDWPRGPQCRTSSKNADDTEGRGRDREAAWSISSVRDLAKPLSPATRSAIGVASESSEVVVWSSAPKPGCQRHYDLSVPSFVSGPARRLHDSCPPRPLGGIIASTAPPASSPTGYGIPREARSRGTARELRGAHLFFVSPWSGSGPQRLGALRKSLRAPNDKCRKVLRKKKGRVAVERGSGLAAGGVERGGGGGG